MLFKAIAGSGEQQAPGPGNDFWYQPISNSVTGISVTPMSAMKASAVYACVMILAQTIASLPRMMCERTADNNIQERQQHPLQDVLDLAPNARQTALEFWEMQIAFGCLYGNSYAAIVPGPRGAVDQLKPLRPDCITIELLSDDRLRYNYVDPITNKRTAYLDDEIFKIPGFSFNGIEGLAPIFFAQDPIGLAIATEQFGAKFFTNDATPSIVLEHPKTLSAGAVARIKQTWRDVHAGLNNAYSVAVLEEDMKVKSIGVPNKDAQFLETRRYQIAEVARYLRIPLHLIGELEKSTNNNIEQQAIDFVKYTIRPWVKRIEQRVSKDLITSPRFFLKHDLDDLLKGEMLTRYQAYQIGAQVGFLTRNEIRRREQLNPLDGLDKPLTPLNMGGENNGQGGADKQPVPGRTPQGGDAISAVDLEGTCAHVVRDAFDRIISSEVANVTALCKKHATAPDMLVQAVEEFYNDKHSAYMQKALTPCAKLCNGLALEHPNVSSYVSGYVKHRITHALAQNDAASYIDEYVKSSAANLVSGWFRGEVWQ